MPFLGWKQGFSSKSKKESNKRKTKQNKQKIGGLWAKWGGPLGQLTWPLHPKKQKQTKTNKEGLGPSEVALWATSPDPYTIKKQNKKTKRKQKTKKHQKRAFQLSVKFFCVSVLVPKCLFTIWPQKRAAQKHSKIGVSANQKTKNSYGHQTAIFGPQKPKTWNSSYLFLPFSSFEVWTTKEHKIVLKPLFL